MPETAEYRLPAKINLQWRLWKISFPTALKKKVPECFFHVVFLKKTTYLELGGGLGTVLVIYSLVIDSETLLECFLAVLYDIYR